MGKIKIQLSKIFSVFYRIFCKIVPTNNNMVIFIAFHGRGYLDNPKAIHRYMSELSNFKNYSFIWPLKHKKEIKNAKVVQYLSLTYFYYMARSKYWISNCKLPSYIYKKKNQIYLQTWHGTPLKRLGHDIVVSNKKFYRSGLSAEEMKKTYDDDVSKYNYMLSPNSFCTKVFQSAFRINKERLIETGYPRNDILSNYTKGYKQDIFKKYGLPSNKKIILYAPTWRDNQFNVSGYVFELKVDFKLWKEILGEDYIILYKPHYLIINKMKKDKALDDFVYEIDADAEISDLYIISDILITDYSSVFFDYAILKRPIYFYMQDIKEYQHELRGFYLAIHKDLPGNIYETEKEMLEDIVKDRFDYKRLDEFNERFNYLEDGKGAKRVVDILFTDRGYSHETK